MEMCQAADHRKVTEDVVEVLAVFVVDVGLVTV
jgi:hypothetical protein